jgi:AH receptor-interacting protein
MELILGKKFKLEVWETCLRTMWLNEVAEFRVVKNVIFHLLLKLLNELNLNGKFLFKLVLNYASCAKQLRDYYKKKSNPHHQHDHAKSCCGFSALKDGLGYPDLDELFKAPQDLVFIFGKLIRRSSNF